MKKILIFFLITGLGINLMAQSAMQNVREGNEAFKSNQFDQAEQQYRKSVRDDGNMVEASFNLGDALYRQGKYEDASRYFLQAAEKAEDKNIKSKAYHNLGNSFLKNKDLEKSIAAYKNALINNPSDEESRYNLSYALAQQQQEQEQQEQEQDQEDQEEKEDEEDEEKENEEKQDQEQEQDEEKQEEENKEQEEQEQEEQEQEQKEQKEQQQEQKEQQVSREDAERILEALNEKEKQIQEKLKKQKGKKVNMDIEKDW